jgi:hypothetical protein
VLCCVQFALLVLPFIESFMINHSPVGIDTNSTRERTLVKIADITVLLENLDLGLQFILGSPMEQFIVNETQPDAVVQLSWCELCHIKLGEKIFDSGGIWQLYKNANQYLFRLAAPFSNWLPYRIARFNSDFSFGEMLCERRYFPEGKPVYFLEYPLDELLFMNLLARGKGAEVHACGLRDTTGEGYLFIGQSGAGKSTTARLWLEDPEMKILTDERVMLRRSGEQIIMHGTPWHGDAGIASPDKAVLNKVFFLRHWHKNELVRLGQTEAAARFFACSFPPFYSSEGLDFVLSFFAETVQRVPAYEFRFVPDASAVEFVRQSHLD